MQSAKAMTSGVTLEIGASAALQLQLTTQRGDLHIPPQAMGGNGMG
jgi:hypothetical protein